VSEPNTLNVIGKEKEGRLKDAKLFFSKKFSTLLNAEKKCRSCIILV
jgi:hypothetical protein